MFVFSIVVCVTLLLVADSVTRASKSDNAGINFLIVFYLANYGNSRIFSWITKLIVLQYVYLQVTVFNVLKEEI